MPTKKGKSLSIRNQATDRIRSWATGGMASCPWPNLPHPLLNSIGKNRHLWKQISCPGMIKSWASSTRRCKKTRHPELPVLYDLEACKWGSARRRIPLDCITCGEYEWPWGVSIPIKFVAKNFSSPTTFVVVTGISSPALVAYRKRPNQSPWIKIGCTEVDPYDTKKQFMQFTNIIPFQGKFYALSLQGALAVLEEADSGLVITTIGVNRAVPSVASRYFKEYMFESNGEILLAFLIYQKTLTTVDEVQVYRLVTPRLGWIKLESLQEKALFLERNSCMWVDSREVGCKGNCVYFSTHDTSKEWPIYDMKSSCILPRFIDASLPFWSEPL